MQSDHQPSTKGQKVVENPTGFILALEEHLALWICPVGIKQEPLPSPCTQQVMLAGNHSSGLSTHGVVPTILLCLLA